MAWYVYLLRCADRTLYCGVTTDLERRLHEHNSSRRGARYTRARRRVSLAWSRACADRAEACRQEARIKALSRAEKEALCRRAQPPPCAASARASRAQK